MASCEAQARYMESETIVRHEVKSGLSGGRSDKSASGQAALCREISGGVRLPRNDFEHEIDGSNAVLQITQIDLGVIRIGLKGNFIRPRS